MAAQKKASQKAKKKAIKKRKRKAKDEKAVEETLEKTETKTTARKSKRTAKAKAPAEKPSEKPQAGKIVKDPEAGKTAKEPEAEKPVERPETTAALEEPEVEKPVEKPEVKKAPEEPKEKPLIKKTAPEKLQKPVVTAADIPRGRPARLAEMLERVRAKRTEPAVSKVKELDAGIKVERLEKPEGSVVIKLGGFLQRREATQVLSTVENLQKDGVKYVLFDMSGVQYANSSAIGAFVNCASKLKAAGGNAALVAMRQNILNVFKTLGLSGLFVIAGSREKALAAIR